MQMKCFFKFFYVLIENAHKNSQEKMQKIQLTSHHTDF